MNVFKTSSYKKIGILIILVIIIMTSFVVASLWQNPLSESGWELNVTSGGNASYTYMTDVPLWNCDNSSALVNCNGGINTSYELYNLSWTGMEWYDGSSLLNVEALEVTNWNQKELSTGDSVAHYRFNDSEEGIGLALYGVSGVGGKINGAYDFESSETDYVDTTETDTGTEGTWSIWYNRESTGSSQPMISNWQDRDNGEFHLYINDGGSQMNMQYTDGVGIDTLGCTNTTAAETGV